MSDPVRRIIEYRPEPGDRVLLELSRSMPEEEMADIREAARQVFGKDIEVIVLDVGIRFAGVDEERARMRELLSLASDMASVLGRTRIPTDAGRWRNDCASALDRWWKFCDVAGTD